jgi:hypothetical protein
MGELGHSSTVLVLSTRWRWVGSFMTLPLNPWEQSSGYSLRRRLSGCHSHFECYGKEKMVSCPCQKLNPGCLAHSLFTILDELSWFHKHSCYIQVSPWLSKIRTGFGVQSSSLPALELCSTSGLDTQIQQRERATYQRSLLGKKQQQHFNSRQNITVQWTPAI